MATRTKPPLLPGVDLDAGSALDAMLAAWTAPLPSDVEGEEAEGGRPLLDYTKWDGDPVGFVEEVLGITLWGKQRDILRAAVKHRRVFVRAGHSVGKTFTMACLVLYWMYAHQGDVVSTAPTKNLVQELLWAEIHKLRANAPYQLPAVRESLTSLATETNRAYGFTSSKEQKGTGSQGKHHARQLVILDEAYGIHAMFWIPLITQAFGEGGRVVAIGNPTDPTSRAATYDKSGKWHRIRISCLEHPNITEGRVVIEGAVVQSDIDEVADIFGKESADYAERILGEYPPADADEVLCPREWVEACIRPAEGKEVAPDVAAVLDAIFQQSRHLSPVLGVDVGKRKDATVTATSRGGYVENIELAWKRAVTDTAWRLVSAVAHQEGAFVNIDAGPVAEGAIEILESEGVEHAPVNFGRTAVKDMGDILEYANERSCMLWRLRRLIQKRELSLPPGPATDMLIDELEAIRWGRTPTGKIQMEDKDEVKSRLGRSPDVSDALALCYVPVVRKATRRRTHSGGSMRSF